MNDGNAMSNGTASWVTDAGPMLSRSTTPTRVESDSAWKTGTREVASSVTYLGTYLTIEMKGHDVNG